MRFSNMGGKALGVLLVICVVGLSACGKGESDKSGVGAQALTPQGATPPPKLDDGSGPGNGGGAIVRNGNVLTLAQAGIEIPIIEAPASENVAEIKVVASLIEKLALSDGIRGNLLRLLEPNGARKYFKIEERDLNPEKRAKLLAAYYSVIGQAVPPEDELTLVALTIGSETFLLPEFYKLSDSSARAAILFHEALWVRNPKLRLSSVLRAEIAIEKLLRSGAIQQKVIYDFELFQVLKEALQDRYLGVVGAARKDFEKGPMKILLPRDHGSPIEETLAKPQFPIRWLLGDNVVGEMRATLNINKDILYGYFYYLSKLNPSLRLLKEMQLLVEQLRMNFVSQTGTTYGGDPYFEAGAWNGREKLGSEFFDLSQSWDMKVRGRYRIKGFIARGGTTEDSLNAVMNFSVDDADYEE